MDLLAVEITVRTGKDPGDYYNALTAEFGTPLYTRIDAPATPEQKLKLEKLVPAAVDESTLAGEPIIAKLSRAPGNDTPIEGLKVVAASGWFAASDSGQILPTSRSCRFRLRDQSHPGRHISFHGNPPGGQAARCMPFCRKMRSRGLGEANMVLAIEGIELDPRSCHQG